MVSPLCLPLTVIIRLYSTQLIHQLHCRYESRCLPYVILNLSAFYFSTGIWMAEGNTAQVARRRVLPGASQCGHQQHRCAVILRVPDGERVWPGRDLAEDVGRSAEAVIQGELPRRVLGCQCRGEFDIAEDGVIIGWLIIGKQLLDGFLLMNHCSRELTSGIFCLLNWVHQVSLFMGAWAGAWLRKLKDDVIM